MPSPYPKYRPQFTAEALDHARHVIRQHTAPHTHVVRAQMVVILAESPSIGNDDLAQHVGIHDNTACKWRKRWATEGFTLEDHPRSGRPEVFSPGAHRSGQGYGLSPAGRTRASAVAL